MAFFKKASITSLRCRLCCSPFMPPSGRERVEVRTWEALADGLLDASIAARLEAVWPGRSAEQRSAAWIERQLGRVHSALRAMSQGLGDKPFCVGIHMSLADIATGVALGYLDYRFPELDWRAAHPKSAPSSNGRLTSTATRRSPAIGRSLRSALRVAIE